MTNAWNYFLTIVSKALRWPSVDKYQLLALTKFIGT